MLVPGHDAASWCCFCKKISEFCVTHKNTFFTSFLFYRSRLKWFSSKRDLFHNQPQQQQQQNWHESQHPNNISSSVAIKLMFQCLYAQPISWRCCCLYPPSSLLYGIHYFHFWGLQMPKWRRNEAGVQFTTISLNINFVWTRETRTSFIQWQPFKVSSFKECVTTIGGEN